MNRFLKPSARLTGIALLIISMIFSYYGFDFNFNNVGGANWLFVIMGITMTTSVTIVQMVFNTSFSQLNPTLFIFGLLSYVYSVWTNYMGLTPFTGIGTGDTEQLTTFVVALFLDVVPEPLIAWSLAESLKGDPVGNALKGLGGLFGFKPSTSYSNNDTGGNKKQIRENNVNDRPGRHGQQHPGENFRSNPNMDRLPKSNSNHPNNRSIPQYRDNANNIKTSRVTEPTYHPLGKMSSDISNDDDIEEIMKLLGNKGATS